jgi:iron complex transport system ATP-binding protein
MSTILELNRVSYVIGEKRIVDKASWKLLHGQHWAILGPNGAGKTTLLRMACGYIWPNDGGTILRNGEESLDLRELRRSIGWVSAALAASIPRDERTIDTVVSGRFAQVGLMRMEWDPPTDDDYDQAHEKLKQIHCDHLVDRPFSVLSQGEQQRVLIARAGMAKPLLVVLDEPCTGLDPGARELFLDGLQNMAMQPGGPSLVLVTHRLEEIMPAFKWVLAMNEGRIVGYGLRAEVANSMLMAKLYGRVPAQMISHNGRAWPIW